MYLLKTVLLSAMILVVLAEDAKNATRSKRQQIAFYPRHGGRPPPYAVQMEPIVQYSQRDPLYNPAASSKSDDHAFYDDDNLYNHYSNEPEPIIEIIIKESNETLPTPVPPTPVPQPRPTKEPIQVFYVKYEKKKGYGDTKPRVVYDTPIPALNPVEEHEVIKPEDSNKPQEEQVESIVHTSEPTTTESTTTLRTIIRPESEVYHSGSSGIRVTFGTDQVPPNNHNKRSDPILPSTGPPLHVRSVTPLPLLESPKRQHGPYNPLQPVHTRVTPAFPQQRIVNSFPPQQQPFPPNYPGSHPHLQPVLNGPRPSQRPPITIQGLPELQQRLPFQNFGAPHRISINHPQQPGFPNTVSVSHQSVHIQNQPPSLLPAGNFNTNLRQQHPHLQQQQPYQPQEAHQAQQQQQVQHPHQSQQSHQAHQAHRPQQQQQHQSQYPQQQAQKPLQQPLQQPPHQQQQPHPQQHVQPYKQQQELEKQRYHQEQRRQQELRYREQQRQQEQQQQQQLEQQRQQEHQRKVEQQRLIEQQRQQERQRQEEQQRIQEQQRYHLEQQQRREQEQENKLLQQQQYRQQINFGQPETSGNQQLQPSSQQSKPGSEILKAVPKLEQHYAIRENPLHPGPFPPNPQIQTVQYPDVEKNIYSQKAPSSPEDLQQQQQYFLRSPTNVPSIATSQQQQQQQQHQQHLQGTNGIPKQTSYQNDQQSFFAQNLPTPQQQRIQVSSQPSLWGGRPVFQDRGNDKIYATPVSDINDPGPTAPSGTVFSNYFNDTRLPVTTTPKTPTTVSTTTQAPKNEARIKENIANLPDEVPEDIRQQLLSSGILGNADIQVLDYDKVGGIPIENLPPEALANFYGAGGAAATAASEPVPTIVKRPKNVSGNGLEYTKKKTTFTKVEHATLKPGGVQMKVVHFDPNTAQGQAIADQHIREDATHLKPVSIGTKINETQQYNRYLPLKVSGASFPIPDVPELRGRRISSVVVLAPVDYSDFRENSVPNDNNPDVDDVDTRQSRMHNGAQTVKFLAGDSLKQLVKKPNAENYTKWLEQERHTEPQRQSVVLLVTTLEDDSHGDKEIFMYDVSSQLVSKLSGDLSSAFVNAAESNSDNSGNIDDSTFETY